VAKLTRAEASRIKGTSRAAITQAVRHGRLKSNKDGSINPDHPKNKRYFKRPAADGHRKSRTRTGLGIDVVKAKAEVERRLKRLQCEKLEIDNAVKRGEFAPRLSAIRTMSDLGVILNVHFLHMPKRMVAMLIAKVHSGEDSRAIEQYLTEEIARGIENFKAAAIAKFKEHIAEMDEEDRDAKQKK